MRDDSDDRNLVIVDDAAIRGLARWAPMAVVISVIGGFMALSWYAYHAGIQSVKDEDLLVVEADKTPMKEKPLDPGGMQFPNQDKTIFDTFAGSSQPPLKVERVLPKPEEPISKDVDTSDTSTWINDKLQKHDEEASPPAAKEKIIGSDEKKTASEQHGADHQPHDHQVIMAKSQSDDEQSETYVAHKPGTKPEQALDSAIDASSDEQPASEQASTKADKAIAQAKEAAAKADIAKEEKAKADLAKEEKLKEEKAKAEQAKEEKAKLQQDNEEKPKEEKKAKAAASGDTYMVQLGAYRSEDEANEAWEKMHLKQKELSDKESVVIKADLGEKGIYYRLRVGGIASSADAKALCSALTSKGQACILPTDK